MLEAEYEVPYLAHACMEPLNCVAHVTAGKCEIWTGTQFQSHDARTAAEILSIPPEQVQLHTTYLGGGFGRRGNAKADYVSEAVELAKRHDQRLTSSGNGVACPRPRSRMSQRTRSQSAS